MGLDVSLKCLWHCKPRKWKELGFAEDEQHLHLQIILLIPPDLDNLYGMLFKPHFFFYSTQTTPL